MTGFGHDDEEVWYNEKSKLKPKGRMKMGSKRQLAREFTQLSFSSQARDGRHCAHGRKLSSIAKPIQAVVVPQILCIISSLLCRVFERSQAKRI